MYRVVEIEGYSYYIPEYALHRPAVQRMLEGRIHEQDLHEFVRDITAGHSGNILHAGTFYGDMLPHFSQYTDGMVYAFEPVLENFILANYCVNHNNLSNVMLLNAAVSNTTGVLRMNTEDPDEQSKGLHAGGGSYVSEKGLIAPCITIDSLNITDLLLLQLDIEGHELHALEGAKNTILSNRPVIAVEDHKHKCDNFLLNIDYRMTIQLSEVNIWEPHYVYSK